MNRKEPKVIFIGPDCGGKSSLAELLGKRWNLEVKAHRKINSNDMLITVMKDALTQLQQREATFVRDQYYYPVDIIYQQTLGQHPSHLTLISEVVANAYKEAGVIFVYVTASLEVLADRYFARGDELWSLKQIQRVAKAYESWYEENKHSHHLVRIDTSGMQLEDLINLVEEAVMAKMFEIRGIKSEEI